jgi:ribulose 1,5-bisphosphate synthetase/thiazole synthase
MQNLADIVFAGARPAGLLTAIELGLGGVRVFVWERLAYWSPRNGRSS